MGVYHQSFRDGRSYKEVLVNKTSETEKKSNDAQEKTYAKVGGNPKVHI